MACHFCSSSVQFKITSVHSEKPTCTPSRLSKVSPTWPSKKFQRSSDCWWLSLVLSRKMALTCKWKCLNAYMRTNSPGAMARMLFLDSTSTQLCTLPAVTLNTSISLRHPANSSSASSKQSLWLTVWLHRSALLSWHKGTFLCKGLLLVRSSFTPVIILSKPACVAAMCIPSQASLFVVFIHT